MVGSHFRGAAEIVRGVIAPAAMVVAAALSGGRGFLENLGGGSGPMAFLGLVDSTQFDGLAPDPQGVSGPTNVENQGGRSDATTNVTTGGGGRNPPPMKTNTGRGRTGSWGYV